MNKYKTEEGIFFVDIEEASESQIKNYYSNSGEMKSSSTSASTPRVFKKATILHTFDEEKYPIDSVWIMGESPGMKINFFGEKIMLIKQKDLYARID